MKKLTPRRLPRKLVLRAEAIAQLAATQLGEVAGGSLLNACHQQSNLNINCG
jgi:hypothetical protein